MIEAAKSIMPDDQKSGAELLQELNALRRRVAELKQVQKALQESEQRFKTIFDNAADGILLADVENKKFHSGNTMICQMLGYGPEEIKGLGVADIHPRRTLALCYRTV